MHFKLITFHIGKHESMSQMQKNSIKISFFNQLMIVFAKTNPEKNNSTNQTFFVAMFKQFFLLYENF